MKCHLSTWECDQCGGTTTCTVWTALKTRDAEIERLRGLCGIVAAAHKRQAGGIGPQTVGYEQWIVSLRLTGQELGEFVEAAQKGGWS